MGSLFDADISEADLDSEQCSLFEAFCNQRLATTPIINRSPYLTGVAVYMFLRHAAEVCVADASSKLVNNESMQLMLDLGSVTMSRIGSGKFDGEIKNGKIALTSLLTIITKTKKLWVHASWSRGYSVRSQPENL